uniref:Uncharacterized protein n=1 Tax=Peromyscus maniculatus bairdii TaxID=230844 RepID=A0A8C8W1A5_PERMB
MKYWQEGNHLFSAYSYVTMNKLFSLPPPPPPPPRTHTCVCWFFLLLYFITILTIELLCPCILSCPVGSCLFSQYSVVTFT